jgi:hypothetical protein
MNRLPIFSPVPPTPEPTPNPTPRNSPVCVEGNVDVPLKRKVGRPLGSSKYKGQDEYITANRIAQRAKYQKTKEKLYLSRLRERIQRDRFKLALMEDELLEKTGEVVPYEI